MNEYVILNKPLGKTPLEALEDYRATRPELKDVPMTYCGRLDPMAEGVLPVLIGERVHEKPDWIKLDKTYEAEILFGVTTDTYDLLGLVGEVKPFRVFDHEIDEPLREIDGEIELPLPAFSSYRVKGKPLHWWAREGRLDEIEIPRRVMRFYDTQFYGVTEISSENLLSRVEKRVKLVSGDFRQDEIAARWNQVLPDKQNFTVAKIKVSCSSGSFVRSLAHELGQRIGSGAILFSLKRTRVGEFEL